MPTLLLGLELTPGLEAWFTPLWLIGIGCLLGVLGASLIWVASRLLSKFEKLNKLMEDPKRARIIAAFAAVIPVALVPALSST